MTRLATLMVEVEVPEGTLPSPDLARLVSRRLVLDLPLLVRDTVAEVWGYKTGQHPPRGYTVTVREMS